MMYVYILTRRIPYVETVIVGVYASQYLADREKAEGEKHDKQSIFEVKQWEIQKL